MFQKNEGPVDRVVRVIVGIALIPIGLFVWDGIDGSIVGIVAAAFGGWFILTGAVGFCPLYVPFGFNTLPKSRAVHHGRGVHAH